MMKIRLGWGNGHSCRMGFRREDSSQELEEGWSIALKRGISFRNRVRRSIFLISFIKKK